MMYDVTQLTPLRFRPILREYLWGGRRLGDVLGKPIGHGDHYAESWEVVDHGADQSVVVDGSLAGKTLHELVAQDGKDLFGVHNPLPQFPLLFKFLDACQLLSVQVHPNDAQAARLNPPDMGKTEAWVVLAAEPGSKIFAGLKPGVDRRQLEQAIAAGVCDECLHVIAPKAGDCILIEAGTVHALGGGLLVAEIQQSSDTTFRLFDWNRVDTNGKPRALHIREALEVIDFSRGPVHPQVSQPTERPYAERLAACDKFVLERWQVEQSVPLESRERFHILSVLEGEVVVTSANAAHALRRGDTILIPACCQDVQLQPQGRATLLNIYLP